MNPDDNVDQNKQGVQFPDPQKLYFPKILEIKKRKWYKIGYFFIVFKGGHNY